MKRDIRRALQFIHKKALTGAIPQKQGICFNLQLLVGYNDYNRFKSDAPEIYANYANYSGNLDFPIKSDKVGEGPAGAYLQASGTNNRWEGEQLQKRLELLEVMIQFYAPIPKKRVKKDGNV